MNEEILQKIYYDPSHPAGLSSPRKLFNAAKLLSPTLSLEHVRTWLSKQFTYTLHKPARRRFRRNPTIVDNVDEQWQADLVDMQAFVKENKGFKYLLTVIDIFSKFAWVVPLKTKKGSEVKEAFQTIFRQRIPVKLQTDQGREFVNEDVKKYLKSKNVHFFTSLNRDIKCAVVERFNRTLRARMFKYFTSKGTRTYIDQLQAMVDAYNKSFHRSTKKRPVDVNDGNEREVFKNLYGFDSPREYHLAMRAKPRLKPQQMVRIPHPVKPFDRGFYPMWSDRLYKIKSSRSGNKKPYYRLVGQNEETLPQRFYPEQVQPVTEDLYRVENILRQRKRNGKSEYFVKWLGYPESYNSWIDASQLQNL